MSTVGDPQPTGRDRLMAALRRPGSRGQITAAVLLAVVGFAAVTQIQAQETDDRFVGARQQDLIQLLNQLSAASQRAENEISQLEQTRTSLRNNTDSRRIALEQARAQAATLGILAGTLPATGPGIRVVVRDPSGAVGTDQLLNGLEELRDAGAEAIEINGVRVVAQTAIVDGEEGLVVDGEQLHAPYTIRAIGSPQTLATGLKITSGFRDEVVTVGGRVSITQLDQVDINSTRSPGRSQYAEPVPNQ